MDKSDVTLERMRIFVRVAERGSLSAVARELAAGQSSVSRNIRELEEALGVPLLSRTTRRVALTDEGRRYYDDARAVLRLVEQAGEDVRSAQDGAEGTVRLSVTAALGIRHIAPLIFDFNDRHPGIEIDLSLTDERIDLVREGMDIALRLGPLADSALRLRPLGESRRILVASTAYLETYGEPASPADLAGHDCLRMTNIAGGDRLTLDGPDGIFRLPFKGRLSLDHGLAAREACLAGRGIALAHVWLVDDLLADGHLKEVLPDWSAPSVALNMLIVPERAMVRRVRLLVDFLASAASRIPGIDGSQGRPLRS